MVVCINVGRGAAARPGLRRCARLLAQPTHIVEEGLAARGVDPDPVELASAVQLAGRARRAEVVVFADCRYARHRQYLEQFYELEEVG